MKPGFELLVAKDILHAKWVFYYGSFGVLDTLGSCSPSRTEVPARSNDEDENEGGRRIAYIKGETVPPSVTASSPLETYE